MVLRSIARRPMVWLAAAIYAPVPCMLVIDLAYVGLRGRHMMTDGTPLISTLFGLAYLMVALLWHLRLHLAAGREALLPRAAAVNVATTFALMALSCVGVPLLLAASCGLNVLGCAGLIVALLGAVAWWAHLQSMLLFFVLFPAWMGLFSRTGLGFLERLTRGEMAEAAAAMLAVGAGLWVALAARLLSLHEEHAEYYRLPTTGFNDWQARMTGRNPEVWRSYDKAGLLTLLEPSPRLLAKPAGGVRTFAQRVRRRRFGASNGRWMWPIWFVGMMLLVWLVRVLWLAGVQDEKAVAIVSMQVPAVWLVVVPTAVAGRRLTSARLVLPLELLKPASRRDCYRELGAALLIELFLVWSAVAAGWAVVTLALEPQRAADARWWLFLLTTGAGQLMVMGVWAWMARYRSPLLIAVAAGMFGGAAAGGSVIWTRYNETLPLSNYAMILLAAGLLGVALLAWAYRKWLKMEVV